MIECLVNTRLMWCCYLVLFIIYCGINQLLCIHYNAMHNCGDCMVIILVIILVIMHHVESHASWCIGFGLVLVCSGPIMGIHEQVSGSRWKLMKCCLW